MSWFPAPCIGSLQRDLTKAFPNRTLPDWILGDADHSSRTSDHNPDSRGMVHAIDIRLGGGLDPKRVLEAVIGDPRVAYVIFNRIIYSRTYGWAARAYTGSNPHDTHIHVSFIYSAVAEQDLRPWDGIVPKVVPALVDFTVVRNQFRIAADVQKGKVRERNSVRRVQRALAFEVAPGLAHDGVVGKKTLDAWLKWESREDVPGVPRTKIPDRQSLRALVEPKWKMVA